MASGSGDRFVVRIGGDATAPLIVGSGNHVEIRQAAPDAAARSTSEVDPAVDPDAGPPSGAAPAQANTANDHGTVYTVMEGEMHIHYDGPRAAEDDAR
ncbi:hypothetical protein [Streptodolium elevatio]